MQYESLQQPLTVRSAFIMFLVLLTATIVRPIFVTITTKFTFEKNKKSSSTDELERSHNKFSYDHEYMC
jgi:hypothetical protein